MNHAGFALRPGFVNRRSSVQVRELAPQKSREINANCGFRVDQPWTSGNQRCDIVPVASVGHAWTPEKLRELAEIYLRAVAVGAPANELAVALADAVLGSELVQLAQAVLSDEQYRYARATELAGKILDSMTSNVAIDVGERRHV